MFARLFPSEHATLCTMFSLFAVLMSHSSVCSHNLSPALSASSSGTWITILVHLAVRDKRCLCSDGNFLAPISQGVDPDRSPVERLLLQTLSCVAELVTPDFLQLIVAFKHYFCFACRLYVLKMDDIATHWQGGLNSCSVWISGVCWKVIRGWESLRWQNGVKIDTDTVETAPPVQFSDLWYINHPTFGDERHVQGLQWCEVKRQRKRIWEVGITDKGATIPSVWWGKLKMGEQLIEEPVLWPWSEYWYSAGIWGRGQNPILGLDKEEYG